jgi:D-alanyl-D-alanine carboxypeptidase
MVEQVPATGLTASIQFADDSVWTGAAGSTHPQGHDDQRAVVADDSFAIASITKSFTAGLLLHLVDEGLISLEESFDDWVPGGHARGSEITVRQLLEHSAGVPEYTSVGSFQLNYTAIWTDAEILALLAERELTHEPGAGTAYSNSHYVLLAMIATAATGMPWRQALEERVLSPLALPDTTCPEAGERWGNVVPSWLGDAAFSPIIDASGISAAGCIVSDADDVARWTRARFGGGFLSEEMTVEQTAQLQPLGNDWYLGLGVLVVDGSEGPPEHGHNGALNGYAGWSGYRPDIDAAISLLGNAWGPGNPPDYQYPSDAYQDLWDVVDEALAARR